MKRELGGIFVKKKKVQLIADETKSSRSKKLENFTKG